MAEELKPIKILLSGCNPLEETYMRRALTNVFQNDLTLFRGKKIDVMSVEPVPSYIYGDNTEQLLDMIDQLKPDFFGRRTVEIHVVTADADANRNEIIYDSEMTIHPILPPVVYGKYIHTLTRYYYHVL